MDGFAMLVGSFKRKRQRDISIIGIRTVMHTNTHTKEIRKLCGAGKLTSQGTETESKKKAMHANHYSGCILELT